MGKIKECRVYLEDNKHHRCLSKIIKYDKKGRIRFCVEAKRSDTTIWNPILKRFPISDIILYKCFKFGPLSILVENWFDVEKPEVEKEVPTTKKEIEAAKKEEEENGLKVKECYLTLFGRPILKINEEHYEHNHYNWFTGKLIRKKANDPAGYINDLKIIYGETINDPIQLVLNKLPEAKEGEEPIDPLYGSIIYDIGLEQYSFKSKDNSIEVLFADAELQMPTYVKFDDPMFGHELWFEYYDDGVLKLKRTKKLNAPAETERIYRYEYR